ncbi:MAG: TonB-dependent receptor [Gammaproteobacteria bacterium]
MNGNTEEFSTHQKALAINMDHGIYGTVAEIGAGQEVARWFFRVGGAAGSIAKTISAYDMQVSDQIYGKSGRYVSRGRVEDMLDKEYRLLGDRLGDARESHTRFFAFADTVAARNFAGTNDCHGWVGLRFQTEPGSEPNDVILHVNMLDRTNLRQQEALGILGINLIYAAFHTETFTPDFLHELQDDLNSSRIEVDLAHTAGPALKMLEPLEIGMSLVHENLAQAVLFGPDGRLAPPNEIFRKRQVIVERGLYQRSTEIDPGVLRAASRQLARESTAEESEPLALMELSVNNLREGANTDRTEYLRRLRAITAPGHWVLLTRLRHSYDLTEYLRRYSQEPLRFALGMSTLAMLFAGEYYDQLPGGLLEATGKLFADNVKIYAHPMPAVAFHAHLAAARVGAGLVTVDGNDDEVSMENLRFRPPLGLLYRYVVEAGWIVTPA